jgi:amphi-Trp domain-containing protein
MSKRKHKLVHESELDVDEVVDLLEDLLAGLRRGELELEQSGDEGESLTLSPSGTLAVELAAKRKGERESLALELKWRRPRAPRPSLRISPVRDPEPIASSSGRKSAALRLRRREPSSPEAHAGGEPAPTRDPATGGLRLDPEPECQHSARLDAELLRALPKQRLYDFARAVDLDGRSQLPKVSLARSLSSHDLRPHLEREDLRTLAASVGIEAEDELEAPTLLDRILERSS